MIDIICEAPWFRTNGLSIPTSTGRTVPIDSIDMRFEDMRRYGGYDIPDNYNWVARWPGDDTLYLTHDHGIVDADAAAELLANWQGQRHCELPDDWWEYALGTMSGLTVKSPKHYRPEELSQEEVDALVAEPLESKLTRVLRRSSV